MFCLLYSTKQKIVKFHTQMQIGKSHMIDIFTSEDMENISLCIFQYLDYIINTSYRIVVWCDWAFALHNFCLQLLHATCSQQIELHC